MLLREARRQSAVATIYICEMEVSSEIIAKNRCDGFNKRLREKSIAKKSYNHQCNGNPQRRTKVDNLFPLLA